MKTFCIQTLGCKVNQYESEQLASLLRARGLIEVPVDRAELRIINTCTVTVQAASQSRQSVRRNTRLPILSDCPAMAPGDQFDRPAPTAGLGEHPSETGLAGNASPAAAPATALGRPRVVVTGCWATGSEREASTMEGVDAVLTHRHDVADELDRLLTLWRSADADTGSAAAGHNSRASESPPPSMTENGWIKAGTAAGKRTGQNKTEIGANVNGISPPRYQDSGPIFLPIGTNTLPLLGEDQSGRQRAFLKIQDGCDAHCTYCIIPKLRPALHSKPIDQAVEEARRLVAAGHVEIVLTGIFLGAYGRATALRRRQADTGRAPLAELVDQLCANVPGLRRLRLSSLEPGDLNDELLDALRSHRQVVPHFHLPLQSGSDPILRRMNRQYTRADFLHMLDRVNAAFDRPAVTTDIIVGFCGEDDEQFEQTLDVARRARFIHIHAFPYSPRPGTAAARWTRAFVHGPVVNERINLLRTTAGEHSLAFRSSFIGSIAEVIVERDGIRGAAIPAHRSGRVLGEAGFPPIASGDTGAASGEAGIPACRCGPVALGEAGFLPVALGGAGVPACHESASAEVYSPPPSGLVDDRARLGPTREGETPAPPLRHGRCERYFPVHFFLPQAKPGDLVRVRIDRATPDRTFGTVLEAALEPLA